MSPYQIDILLWYNSRVEDHPDMSRNPPIWRETINNFMVDGLLTRNMEKIEPMYKGTDRLHVYVDALVKVPLPRPGWLMEYPNNFSMQGWK